VRIAVSRSTEEFGVLSVELKLRPFLTVATHLSESWDYCYIHTIKTCNPVWKSAATPTVRLSPVRPAKRRGTLRYCGRINRLHSATKCRSSTLENKGFRSAATHSQFTTASLTTKSLK